MATPAGPRGPCGGRVETPYVATHSPLDARAPTQRHRWTSVRRPAGPPQRPGPATNGATRACGGAVAAPSSLPREGRRTAGKKRNYSTVYRPAKTICFRLLSLAREAYAALVARSRAARPGPRYGICPRSGHPARHSVQQRYSIGLDNAIVRRQSSVREAFASHPVVSPRISRPKVRSADARIPHLCVSMRAGSGGSASGGFLFYFWSDFIRIKR